MFRSRTERRLDHVTKRLRRAREDLAVLEEQLLVLGDDADEARIRALVADNGGGREETQTVRHAERGEKARAHLQHEIAELEREQDELLDKFVPGSR